MRREPGFLGLVNIVIGRNKTCYYIPFDENQQFTGRDVILGQLQEKVSKKCRKVALVRLGGVGKTQVALHFVYWVKKTDPKCSILWIPAFSDASIEQAYTEVAKQFAIQKATEDEDVKDSVRRYLNSTEAGNWGLIIDNADDPDQLKRAQSHLPKNENGLILFTTRSRKVTVTAARPHVLDLEQMHPEEAKCLLRVSISRQEVLEDAVMVTELLKKLIHLPLAITQAAAYLDSNMVPISEYLRLLQGTEEDIAQLLSQEFDDETRYDELQHAVATTWLVSFKQIRNVDHHAADLVKFISCIEPEAIPQSILPAQNTDQQLVQAVGTLCAYSFLVRRGQTMVFDMHSLVHLVARMWTQREGNVTESTKNAISHLRHAFPSNDYENRDLWREYMPHALAITQNKDGNDVPETYELCFRLGRCLFVDGRISEAVGVFEQCSYWRR